LTTAEPFSICYCAIPGSPGILTRS